MTPTPLPLSVFDESLCFVIGIERGYSNNASDTGGETNYGITHATYDAYRDGMKLPRRSVMLITPREVRTIYFGGYWRPTSCDAIGGLKPNVALVAFDAAVNQGAGEARRMLQRALGVTDDGVIGPGTLAAVETCIEPKVVSALLVERARVYRLTVERNPKQAVNLAGWLARLRWCARATQVPIDPAFDSQS